jgi:hypothetical protein
MTFEMSYAELRVSVLSAEKDSTYSVEILEVRIFHFERSDAYIISRQMQVLERLPVVIKKPAYSASLSMQIVRSPLSTS